MADTLDQTLEFPQPDEPVVLFDLDGTLIDGSYEVTDQEIYASMNEAQEAGWTIGLSSDTPHDVLVGWSREFNIDGPIIAEKGGLVDGLSEDEEQEKTFLELRETTAAYLESCGVVVWHGNPVEAIRNGDKIGKPGDVIVMVNNFRRLSFGLFFRQVDQAGQLQIDTELTDRMVEEVRAFYPESIPDLIEDKNHEFGLLIVTDRTIDKRVGTERLLKAEGLGKIAMVGNSMTDFIGEDLAIHYAVGDATPEYQEAADYVASQPVTSGSVEILRKLLDE